METREAMPNVLIGGQPTSNDLDGLAAQGVVAVVNLRRPGEPDQPLSPDAEGDRVRAAGLDYLHLPIGGAPIERAEVAEFGRFLQAQTSGKVLVHCRSGGRAVVLLMLDHAERNNWPSAEVIERARGLGFEIPPPLRPIVQSYLDSRS